MKKENNSEGMKPQVGIYFYINGTLYAEGKEISEVMESGGWKNIELLHLEYIDILRDRFPEERIGRDYATYPRGRAIYSVSEDKVYIYSDKCLKSCDMEERVLREFNISKDIAVFDYTLEDYSCPKCDPSLKEDFEIMKKMELKSEFERIVKQGLDSLDFDREKRQEAEKRIKYESDLIGKNNEYSYYILLHRIVKYAKEKGILYGPGRDATAGSMVCYALSITRIDPIDHGLMSERFLSNNLESPNVSIDVGSFGAECIVQYLRELFPERISKDEGRKRDRELLDEMEVEVLVDRIIIKTEGYKKRIHFFIYENLVSLEKAAKRIEFKHGKKLDDIGLQDRKVFESIWKGEMEGVFQLEGETIQKSIKVIKPGSICELANIISLTRPGTEEMKKSYIVGKGKPDIDYVHEKLRPILDPTYGVILYQEQINNILTDIGGFGVGNADYIRRRILENNPMFIKNLRGQFIFRAKIHYGIEKEIAAKVFEMVLKATPKVFLKAHTVAYAILAYKEAYWKYYYPEEFQGKKELDDEDLYFYECPINVGIFWITGNNEEADIVFDVEEYHKEDGKHVLEYGRSHNDLWRVLSKDQYDGKYIGYDSEYFPRGRVEYDLDEGKSIVYVDKKIMDNIEKHKEKIRDIFLIEEGEYLLEEEYKSTVDFGEELSYRIIRGKDIIGGNLIEITFGKTKLLVELGKELGSEKELSEIEKEVINTKYDAVIISHYHADHAGLINYKKDCPIYMGEGTKKVLYAIDEYNGRSLADNYITYKSVTPFYVGNIKITAYLCDHSAYDSYMLLFEAEGKRVLYTGDFRFSGRKSKDRLLGDLPSKVNTLICEGTNIRYDEKADTSKEKGEYIVAKTENEIEEYAVGIMESNKDKPVFVLQSSTNIDRLVSIYRASKRSSRIFYMDNFQTSIVNAIGGKIPRPDEFRDVFAFVARYDEGNRYDCMRNVKQKKRLNQIGEGPNFTMLIRQSMADCLKIINNYLDLKDAILIYSLWEGYMQDPSMAEFLVRVKELGMKIITLHTSGHASMEDIENLKRKVNPDEIVVVHTRKICEN